MPSRLRDFREGGSNIFYLPYCVLIHTRAVIDELVVVLQIAKEGARNGKLLVVYIKNHLCLNMKEVC
jgi:hypothetical protein